MAAKSTTTKAAATFVDGAKEMRTALKDLGDRALLRELARNNQEIAGMIVNDAQARTTTRREKIVASRMMQVRSSGNVSVRLPQMVDVNDKRGPRPIGIGTEFGAKRNLRRFVRAPSTDKPSRYMKGWNGFRPWKGNGREAGYFLFPAIRAKRDEAIRLYMEKIEDIWSRRKAA